MPKLGAAGQELKALEMAEPAVLVQDLCFSYSGQNYILEGISFAVGQGEVAMVLGRSGSGKTTLLKLLKGFLRPQRGTVRIFGRPPEHSWERVAYIPQGLGLIGNMTVLQSVLVGALSQVSTLAGLTGNFSGRRAEALSVLEALGILGKADEKVYRLSGGEKQRVAIARAIMQHPRLILADEFISQLDPVTAYDVMDEVTKLFRGKVSLVITTHDMDKVPLYGDKAFVIHQGRLAYAGEAARLNLESIRGLIG